MKNLLSLILLLISTSHFQTFANEGNNQKDLNKNKMAVHTVSGHLQSTITFDGDHTLGFGILNQSSLPVKVQVMWDNTSMMTARYVQVGINGRFDISALPSGTYRIKISSGNEIIEKEFIKTSSATPIFE